MGCPPRPGAGYPSLPPLQHRGPAFSSGASPIPAHRPAFHGAGRFSFYAADAGWNCCSSVEPLSADNELNDPAITWFTVSKYPVPTSRWCFAAV
jgi:hypothetical protein